MRPGSGEMQKLAVEHPSPVDGASRVQASAEPKGIGVGLVLRLLKQFLVDLVGGHQLRIARSCLDRDSAEVVLRDRSTVAAPAMHPNDIDRKRIERALDRRARYRYVTPEVRAVRNGYRVVSPCCSRRIRPDGGVIDIAWLRYVGSSRRWRLYRKDHNRVCWELREEFANLFDALEELSLDADHAYWQ
jgi:hypothetical protein